MKLLVSQRQIGPTQILYQNHGLTLEGAFKWWIKNKNKHCRSFCPLCRYYIECQDDIEYERFIKGE